MILLRLFLVLFLVNLLTIGGGYVALPILDRYFVGEFGWLTRAELADAVAVGQLTPGPMTIMNVFIGHKVAGLAGALVAAAGSYLPSILVVSLTARCWAWLRRSAGLAAALRGTEAAVVGMLLGVCVQLGQGALATPPAVLVGGASFLAMAFTRLDPTVVVAGAAVAGAALL
jgi:chromate transporter